MKYNDRNHQPRATAELMEDVRRTIAEQELSESAAARAIGVSTGTLRLHLAGEHVRSDSAAKYRSWLEGRVRRGQGRPRVQDLKPSTFVSPSVLPPAPEVPHAVVDIFSGCGGLSLGFDLLDGGRFFETVLAMDNQAAPIRVFNANHHTVGGHPVGRQVDLTEFSNETEVLTFYVEHVALTKGDQQCLERLLSLCGGRFAKFRKQIAAADARYLDELANTRCSVAFQSSYQQLDRQCLQQTSVVGFHDTLKLPRTAARAPMMPAVLWASTTEGATRDPVAVEPVLHLQAQRLWHEQLSALAGRNGATGRGQLNSAARRIGAFLKFARSAAFIPVRDAWCTWHAARTGIREQIFGDPAFARAIQQLYQKTYPVAVLLGGPPCQGFSRIGRGKIRSLRDASVHVHGDDEAGDKRNLLFRQYLLCVSAFKPKVFLFENVRGFHSVVKHGKREFLATEVLAEAIQELSDGRAAYQVSSRILDSSRHGVPQTRQRFFMAGVLAEGQAVSTKAQAIAEACLDLATDSAVPLKAALAGLPEPGLCGSDESQRDILAEVVPVVRQRGGDESATSRYADWIGRPKEGDVPTSSVDGQTARTPRRDDAQWYGLMGPGRRWMDYRCDASDTLGELKSTFEALLKLPPAMTTRAGLSRDKLKALTVRLDGSLSIRLMLEHAERGLGEDNHLLADTYLSKRDGNHGDWLARLDGERPSKTVVAHMGKDTYGYVHPYSARTLSVRETARIQSFPDWFSFGGEAVTEAFKMIGNAVPPLLSNQLACQVVVALQQLQPTRQVTPRQNKMAAE